MKNNEMMKSLKVLYVEDEKETREELADVLKRRAGKLYVAANGKEGVSLAETYAPDIIIADLYMPEMNGLDMIRKIRASGKEPAVVIVSAINDVNTVLSAIDVGVSKYILKPVNLKELLEVLSELAEDILSKRKHQTVTLPENRKLLEDEIKRQTAAFLKNTTGKGPRDVNVFIGEGVTEIVATDILTVLEKSMIENGKNIGVVKYVREVFFTSKEEALCEMVRKISGRRVVLQDISINVETNKIKLVFAE